MQKILNKEQIQAFYHDCFVADQVRDFLSLADKKKPEGQVVVDMGGLDISGQL